MKKWKIRKQNYSSTQHSRCKKKSIVCMALIVPTIASHHHHQLNVAFFQFFISTIKSLPIQMDMYHSIAYKKNDSD